MTAVPENNTQNNSVSPERPLNFLEQKIKDELDALKHPKIVTRFPQSPNTYLHMCHATSISLTYRLSLTFTA